jgi:hypothetical protein
MRGGGEASGPMIRLVTKGTHSFKLASMKPFRWGPEKNDQLQRERGITFEQMVVAVEAGGLLDILAHPNPDKFPNQRVLVVLSEGYVYLVPFVEQADHYFLKTVIPSRKATRSYLKQDDPHAED